MAQATIGFSDASGYERFMGRWSRAVAGRFLRWIEPARGAKWLDVGCGTGILTEAVLDLCEPASVTGIDPAAAQIEHASRGPAGTRATFRQADAMTLPFGARAFDITASALVINFIPNRFQALAEMVRVTKPGGRVFVRAGYGGKAAKRLLEWFPSLSIAEKAVAIEPKPGDDLLVLSVRAA